MGFFARHQKKNLGHKKDLGRQKKRKTIFCEILVENFTELMEGMNLQMLEMARRPVEAKIKLNSQLVILRNGKDKGKYEK